MKIGITTAFGPGSSPELMAAVAQLADERPIHSLWVPEHVVFFAEYASQYPYSEDGRLAGDPTGTFEPFMALTWLAAHSRRIRLGTGICLVPQRAPIYTAKQVTDLDQLSAGRLDFGVGIGWLREEFDALGIPFEGRAERTRECIEAMKTLWCSDISSFKGEHHEFANVLQHPKPVQKPHPPIYFGGESDAALRRVAELGQGWYGFNHTPESAGESVRRLELALSAVNRSRGAINIAVAAPSPRLAEDEVKRYADLGIDQLILPAFARSVERFAELLDAVSEIAPAT